MAESMTPEEILEAIHALSPDDQARIHEALAVAEPSPEGFNPMAMMQQMMGRMQGEGMQKMMEQMTGH